MKSWYSFLFRVESASNLKLSASAATNPTENLLKKFILRTAGVVALLLVFGGSVIGQVSNYPFSQSAGTYTAITGGTAHNTVQTDNANYSFTLPFTFTYNGTGYTTVRPTTNGFLVLGANAPAAAQYTPLSSGTTNFAISAFGLDLSSIVRSEVIGASPNRIYVCQWSSVGRYSSGLQADAMNFQIRLYETSNRIDIIYGANTATAASSNVQVGLRGSANTDFNTRSKSGNTAWLNNTSAGTANNSTVNFASTSLPVSGTTFTWTPPAPCTAPTSLAATVTSSAQTNTTITGAFTAATTAPSGYVVVRTTTNTQPTLTNATTYTVGSNAIGYIEYVGTSAGSWTSTGLSAGVTYYYWVFSYNNTACTGGPAYSTSSSTLSQATSSCSGASLAGLSYSSATPLYCSGVAIATNTATLGTTNGTVTYSISPALPTGLTLSTSTGNITGTPSSTSAAATYTVTANNGCTTTTASLSITVVTALSGLTYTSAAPTAYCVGAAISSNLVTAINGGGTITYSVSPALPAGLTLNTSTGEISGTPTVSAASATYTVTATNGSCSTTRAITIIVNNNLSSSTLTYTTQTGLYCQNVAITNNNPTLSPSSNNGTVTYSISPALSAGLSFNTTNGRISGTPTASQAATSYTITATSACGGSTTSVVTITVNTPASVIAPSASAICSGGAGVSLTASGVSTYSWTPTTGLSLSNAATVTANPTATTTYTISGVDANGCTATAGTVTVTVNQTPTAITIAQTPSSVCYGSVATLSTTGGTVSSTAADYAVSISSGATLNSVASPNGTLVNANQDDAASSLTNIGFTFNFAGTNYTQFWVNSNGVVGFSGTTFTSATNSINAATNYPILLPFNDDLGSNLGGITYKLSGSAPNRILTIDFQLGACCGSTSAATIIYQVVLSETSNTIRFIYNTGTPTSNTASIGIASSATKFISFTTPANSYSTSTANNGNSALPASGTSILFTPPSTVMTWSPTTNLYTNAAATTAYTGGSATTVYALNTSSTQYTATATNGSCSTSTSINTSINPLPTITLGTASAVCAGGTSSSLTYTATAGSPNQYIIDFDATANSAGFVDVTSYTAFSASPITLSIPSGVAAGTYNATITVKNSTTGCISSATSFTVTVNAPVSITAQPNNSVSLEGSDASFTLAATGTGLTYQWQVSTDNGSTWSNASGTSTNTSYTEYAISASMAGYQYQCIVSGTAPCGSVTSNVATLSISSTAITTQPASSTICSNGSNTFTIATSGTIPTYQWQLSADGGSNWSDITQATTSSLTVSGLTASNSGNRYRCVLSGSINTDAAVLTVHDAVVIGTQPTSQIVCSNAASATFSISATGSNLTYQWQVSTDSGSSWTNASGSSTSSTYTISSITNALNLNQYRVIVSGSSPCSSVTSDAATLNVIGVSLAASSASICMNGSFTLTATPTSGSPTLSYSWICATAGSGATSANTSNPATITPTAVGSYTYTLTTTGGGCSLTSSTAVTVNPNPSITSATASSATVCAGSSVSLAASSVSISSGTAAVGNGGSTGSSTAQTIFPGGWGGAKTQYLFRASDLIATGLNSGNLTSLAFEPTTSGQTYQGFYVYVNTTSATALTTNFESLGTLVYLGSLANDGFTPTANAVNTLNFGTGAGTSSTFNWDGTSNLIVTFSWSRVPLASTSTSSTMKYDVVPYTCTNYRQADSQTPASMLGQLTGATSTSRPKITFTGQVGTNVTSNFNWSWNTTPAVSAAAGTTTALNNASSSTSQTFTVTATNPTSGCSSSSTTSSITINPTPATPTANSTSVCGTQNATCSVTGSGIVGNTFKWYTVATGGTPIVGQSESSLTAYSVATSTTFYVSESNATCESGRVAVTQTVTTPPSVSASASSATICAGQSTTLSASSSNSGYSYSWSSPAGALASTNVNPTSNTTYTVTATDNSGGANNGCSTSAALSVTVNPLPTSVSASTSLSTICNGDLVNLNSSAISNSPTISTLINEGFESGIPSSWAVIQNGTGNLWTPANTASYGTIYQGSGMLQYLWSSSNAANTYAITTAVALQAGNTYTISFYEQTGAYNERLKLTVGLAQTVAAQSTIIADYPNHQATTWTLRTNIFTPTVSGNYYFGLQAYSTSNKYYINIDNFTVTVPSYPNYSWASSPIGFNSSSQNPSGVAPTQTTTYTVTATNSFNCSASASATVTVNQPSVAPTSISGTNAICIGSSTTLTAENGTLGTGANYQWGTGSTVGSNSIVGETSASITVTPSATTTYWVRITNGTAPCTITTSGVSSAVTVTNPATPVVTAVDNCNGTSTLSTTAVGTLSWSTSETTSPITVSTAGTYTVTQTVNGCTSAAGSGVAAPKTTPVTPSVSVTNACGLSTLVFTPAENALILWSNNAATSSTTTANSETLTVVQTVNGCPSSAGSGSAIPLVIPSAPTATASQNFCVTDNATVASLAYTNVAGNTYTWYDAATAGNTVATSTQLPTATTSFYLSVSGGNGCAGLTRTLVAATESAQALATVSITGTTVCEGGEILFTATPVNGGLSPTYQWYNEGVPISGATGETYSATGLAEGALITVKMIPSGSCVTVCPN